MRETAPIFRLQESLCVVGRETKLAFFAGHVELQQTGDAAFETAPLFVDFAEQLWTVHAVNQRNERNNIFHLVLLQMTYEVPLDVFRHNLLFVKEFLYPTLSENALSSIVGFAQGFDGMKLRNCHERCPCRERPV